MRGSRPLRAGSGLIGHYSSPLRHEQIDAEVRITQDCQGGCSSVVREDAQVTSEGRGPGAGSRAE